METTREALELCSRNQQVIVIANGLFFVHWRISTCLWHPQLGGDSLRVSARGLGQARI
jgi:hypothetical protein